MSQYSRKAGISQMHGGKEINNALRPPACPQEMNSPFRKPNKNLILLQLLHPLYIVSLRKKK